MKLRTFLILTHLCEGVGNSNELRIASFLKIYQTIPTIEELHSLLHLDSKTIMYLVQQLRSETLRKIYRENITQSKVLTILDADYPLLLQESYQPPAVLFYRGNIALLKQPLLAVVGARKCDVNARKNLELLLPPILRTNIVTISGLAQGVDSLTHTITLTHQVPTIGVIGTGLDVVYPRTNSRLQQDVAIKGLLITEYPLHSSPKRYHFPQRNRIIAGLCETLLVVQAKHKSGSLITANIALQNNRNVLAVPGRICDSLSVGCNELIAAGAKIVISPTDILQEFQSLHFWY